MKKSLVFILVVSSFATKLSYGYNKKHSVDVLDRAYAGRGGYKGPDFYYVRDVFLKHWAPITGSKNGGYTALLQSLVGKHPGMAKMLIDPDGFNKGDRWEKSFDLNHRTNGGVTAFTLAADRGFIDILSLLLEKGAKPTEEDINKRYKNRDFETVLHLAIEEKNAKLSEKLVGQLLKFDPDVRLRDANGDTPLLSAVKKKKYGIMNKLLDFGARIDTRDNNNNTALMLLVKDGKVSDVRKLLDLGANPNVRNNDGDTPFLVALEKNNVAVAQELWKKKPDVKRMQNNDGYRPLHYAAKYDMRRLVKEMLEAGADPDVRTKYGFTPLHFASEKGYGVIIDEILKYKPHVSARNKDNKTPENLAKNSSIKAKLKRARGAGGDTVARTVARGPQKSK